MSTKKIEQYEWKNFFDKFSKEHKTTLVTLEVISSEIGDQTEIRLQPLKGLSIDSKSDSLVVFTEDINHSIYHPKDIFVEERDESRITIEILDQDNNIQILQLQDLTKRAS